MKNGNFTCEVYWLRNASLMAVNRFVAGPDDDDDFEYDEPDDWCECCEGCADADDDPEFDFEPPLPPPLPPPPPLPNPGRSLNPSPA